MATHDDDPITDEEILTELRRELDQRRRCYPRWVNAKDLSPKTASRRLKIMERLVHEYEVKTGACLPL